MKRLGRHLSVEGLGTAGFAHDSAMRRHLGLCSTCRERLAQIQRLRDSLACTAAIDLTPSRDLTGSALAQLQRRTCEVARINGLLAVIAAILTSFAILFPRENASAGASTVAKEWADDE